ncbi:hypothetical protein GF357_02905, partial [Candidatus Dojkabacteria bacterium]|nr:hypothetical protein [Candidatus Dojkabacteria bacterium]
MEDLTHETQLQLSLEETKPEDKEEGYPKQFPRFTRKLLETIPGLFTWFMVLSPFIVALLKIPQVIAFVVAFLSMYWSYRAVKFSVGLMIGYKRMIRDLNTDWIGRINKDPELSKRFKELKYLWICPVVKEDMHVLRPSFQALSNSSVGAEKISVVMAIEERFKDEQLENLKLLKEEFGDKFREIVYYVHPKNLPGEVVGVKSANINWAARHFAKLIKSRGEKLENYLLDTSDSDQRAHKKYLAAITYKFLTDPDPMHKFYATAVHTFNNNIWNVPTIIRTQSQILTLGVLQEWVFAKKMREAWSAYVVNFKTVDEVGYWPPDVGNDDTMFHWSAAVHYKGNFSGEEVYIPTHNDAVENENFIKTHKSLYKQQHRWGWGGITFPTTAARLLVNKEIPIMKKLDIIWAIFYKQVLFLTLVYIITLALPIMNIISDEYNYSSYSYNLPQIISYLLSGLLILNLPTIVIKRKITPPPEDWPIWRYLWDIVEVLLTFVNALSFTFIPYIQAYTEMMVG